MNSEANYEQNLLDIEILAVQIQENNKHRKAQQAKQYYQQLIVAKKEEYDLWKDQIKGELKQWAPMTAGLITLGILATRTIFFGSLTGLGLTFGLKPFLTKQLHAKQNLNSDNYS